MLEIPWRDLGLDIIESHLTLDWLSWRDRATGFLPCRGLILLIRIGLKEAMKDAPKALENTPMVLSLLWKLQRTILLIQ